MSPSEAKLKEVYQLSIANPLPEISATAFALGVLGGISIPCIFIYSFYPLPIYILSIALFHFLEYYITASYQADKVSSDSFVINNGNTYRFAHTLALLETLIELYLLPDFKYKFTAVKFIGLAISIIGQFLRSAAMIHCGESFSHLIATEKKSNHILVTTGIYSIVRHPSYVGFFYWALGTQLLLCNPITFALFLFLLYQFFSNRIKYEETKLIQFFGNEYKCYKEKVPVGIPFL